MLFKFRFDDRRSGCQQVAWLAAVLAVSAAAVVEAAATTAGGYHVGLDFLVASRSVPGFGGLDENHQVDDVFHPVLITDPTSNAVSDGGLAGWDEATVQRAVVLAIEDAYRAVDTGDPATTLAVQIHEGLLSAAGPGRRLNAVFGSNTHMLSLGNGFQNAALLPGSPPNGADAAVVLLDRLDQLAGLEFTAADHVINNIAGTAAHEIGHLLGLKHTLAGSEPPYGLMASGDTGLPLLARLTERRFETTPGTQAGGHSSASLLLSGVGMVARTDFDMDGQTTLVGDGLVLRQNLGKTDALFQDGDTNGDHRVDVSSDGFALLRSLANDSVGPGVAEAHYDPTSGQILVSSQGVSALEFISSTGSFLVGNAVRANAFGDVPTATTINYAAFDALGIGGVLDNFSIGAVLPIGLADLSTLQLRYLSGSNEIYTGITFVGVPEPTSFLLLSIGIAGLMRDRLRGSASAAMPLRDLSHVA